MKKFLNLFKQDANSGRNPYLTFLMVICVALAGAITGGSGMLGKLFKIDSVNVDATFGPALMCAWMVLVIETIMSARIVLAAVKRSLLLLLGLAAAYWISYAIAGVVIYLLFLAFMLFFAMAGLKSAAHDMLHMGNKPQSSGSTPTMPRKRADVDGDNVFLTHQGGDYWIEESTGRRYVERSDGHFERE